MKHKECASEYAAEPSPLRTESFLKTEELRARCSLQRPSVVSARTIVKTKARLGFKRRRNSSETQTLIKSFRRQVGHFFFIYSREDHSILLARCLCCPSRAYIHDATTEATPPCITRNHYVCEIWNICRASGCFLGTQGLACGARAIVSWWRR